MWFDTGWGVSLIVFLPLVGAVLILAIPRKNEEAHKWTALITTLVTAVLSIVAAFRFDYGSSAAFQFDTDLEWIPAIGARYHIGIDGISLPLLVLSTVIVVL